MADTLTQQYFSGLSKNTFRLACASLFADISTEMLYPVLPVFDANTECRRQRDDAISASRGAERVPVPSLSRKRAPNTPCQPVDKPISGLAIAASR
jgi:hypothetical protein